MVFSVMACEDRSDIYSSKTYYATGIIKRLKLFNHAKQRGLKKIYYRDGTVRNEIHYYYGRKHGESKFFYPTGKLYSISQYKDGLLHGTVKKYRKNGWLMSEQSFKNNQPANDLVEYNKDKTIKSQPKLMIEPLSKLPPEIDHGYLFYLSDQSREVSFYFGELLDQKFFHDELIEINNGYFPIAPGVILHTEIEQGQGKLLFEIRRSDALVRESFNIIARKKTSLFNTYIGVNRVNVLITQPTGRH